MDSQKKTNLVSLEERLIHRTPTQRRLVTVLDAIADTVAGIYRYGKGTVYGFLPADGALYMANRELDQESRELSVSVDERAAAYSVCSGSTGFLGGIAITSYGVGLSSLWVAGVGCLYGLAEGARAYFAYGWKQPIGHPLLAMLYLPFKKSAVDDYEIPSHSSPLSTQTSQLVESVIEAQRVSSQAYPQIMDQTSQHLKSGPLVDERTLLLANKKMNAAVVVLADWKARKRKSE